MLLPTASRNAAADAVVDKLEDGAGAGHVILKNQSGVTFADITLNEPAFGASATGVATLDLSGGLSATTTADFNLASTQGTAEFQDSNSVVIFTATLGGTTLSREINIDRDTGTSGDTVQITGFTYTQPAGSV